jgi:hypothetical protein
MKFPKILEQLQFYLGIPEDIENEIPCFNLSPVEKKEDKSMDFIYENKNKKNISDAVGKDWLEIN